MKKISKFVYVSIAIHVVAIVMLFVVCSSTENFVSFASPDVIEVEFIEFEEPVPEVVEVEEAPIVEEQTIDKKVEQKKEEVLAEKKVPEKIEKKVEKIKEKPKVDSVKTKVVEQKKEVPVKSGASAEQKSFVYDYYLKMLQGKVYRNFKPPYNLKLEDKVITIYFELDKTGKVSNIKFEKKTQSGLLNRLAMRAIQELKMPPLPQKYVDGGESMLSIHFTFIYNDKR